MLINNIVNSLEETTTLLKNVAGLQIENRSDLIWLHKTIAELFDMAKAVEAEMRIKTVKASFPVHKEEGTETLNLGEGWKLKAVFKQNYKVDKKTIDDDLAKVNALGFAYAQAVEELIKKKTEVEVSSKVYKTLSDEIKQIVNNSITITPGTPTLELIAPKPEGE